MGSWMTQQLYIAMGSDRCYHTKAWVGGSWGRGKGTENCLCLSPEQNSVPEQVWV